MSELLLVETGDGGDFLYFGKELVRIGGFQNMPYLAMFGGNVAGNTGDYVTPQQRFDYWGNDLFLNQQPSIQFNSDTERLLNNIELSSSSRLIIEQTVKNDLKFMRDFADVNVSVSIEGINRVKISIQLSEPDNLESNEFIYIWDATENELVSIANNNGQGNDCNINGYVQPGYVACGYVQ